MSLREKADADTAICQVPFWNYHSFGKMECENKAFPLSTVNTSDCTHIFGRMSMHFCTCFARSRYEWLRSDYSHSLPSVVVIYAQTSDSFKLETELHRHRPQIARVSRATRQNYYHKAIHASFCRTYERTSPLPCMMSSLA